MTSSGKTFLDISPGDAGIIHEIGTDGTLWVRLENALAEAGALWPFRPEQLRHAGARPTGHASVDARAGG